MTTPATYVPSDGDSVILDSTTIGTVKDIRSGIGTCSVLVHGGIWCHGINFNRLKPFNVAKAVELYLKTEEKPKLPEPKPGPIVFWSEPNYTFLDKMNMAVSELTDRGYYTTAAAVIEVMTREDPNAKETWEDDDEDTEEDEEE